ncbi:MAG: hypothetical protein GX033_01060 [Firmicutes bacterium]|nr:hypothetical protein [Bacillota bacterium]
MSQFNLRQKLNIGQRLNVTWNKKVYSSLLMDIGNNYLDIGVLQSLGEQIYLAPGSQVIIGFGIPESGYYRFQTTVLAEIAEPGPAVRVAYPTQIERVQQRRHYRLSISLLFSFRVINDLQSHRSFITHQGQTVDISGGGMQFVSQEDLKYGDRLEIDLPSILGVASGTIGTVLRTADNFDGTYQASVQFENMDRQQEEAIIRFIFQEQVRRRRMQL